MASLTCGQAFATCLLVISPVNGLSSLNPTPCCSLPCPAGPTPRTTRTHLGISCDATPKYSRGDSPGEYGGPPIDVRPRKVWGGDNKDPISNKEEYIWNTEWMKRLDLEERQATAAREAEERKKQGKEKDSGFLSLGRSLALDSIEVDLSAELNQPSKATLERQVAAARQVALDEERKRQADVDKVKWQYAPTRKEEAKWQNDSKFTVGGTSTLLKIPAHVKRDPDADKLAEWEAGNKKFLKLKDDLQLYTLGIGGACAVSACFTYSPQVGASYTAGLVGALAYIRMLSNSVESVGASSLAAGVKGALGQQRMLVPVVLVMAFNRWNAIVALQYDVMPLELIPMLIGFFTYKAATLVQTFQEVLAPYEPKQGDL